MKLRSLSMLVAGTLAFGSQPSSDLPITTYLSDYNATGAAYYIQSDGGGAYKNGVSGITSILVANGYNHITWGDWRLDLRSSTRNVVLTFSSANAIQSGNPSYTAPANPPFWGTQLVAMHMENKCSESSHDMYTMKPRQTFTCNTLFRLPNTTSSTFYRLDMGTFSPAPETQQVQVTCNSVASDGNCNDWFIDPIPVVNADGSTSPGQTVARLNLVNTKGTGTYTNEGDFYLTFHIHVTRP